MTHEAVVAHFEEESYPDIFLHGMRVSSDEARAHLLHSHRMDLSGIPARNSELYNLHESQHPEDGPESDEHYPDRPWLPRVRSDIEAPDEGTGWEEGDDASHGPVTGSRAATAHLPVQDHFEYYNGGDNGSPRTRDLRAHLYRDHMLLPREIPGGAQRMNEPHSDPAVHPEMDEVHRAAHQDEEQRAEHDRQHSYQSTGYTREQLEDFERHPAGEDPAAEPPGGDAFSHRHQPYVESPRSGPELYEHLMTHHGVTHSPDSTKQPGQGFLISLHDKMHYGEFADHPDVQARTTPHQHESPEGRDPVLGARALVAHFERGPVALDIAHDAVLAPCGPVEAATGAIGLLGSQRPQDAAGAVALAQSFPEVLTALRDALLRVHRTLEDMPVHPDVLETLYEAARALTAGIADAERAVAGLPTEASWETPGGSPNR